MSQGAYPSLVLTLCISLVVSCGSQDRTRDFMPAPESEMVYEVTLENPFASPDTTTGNGSDLCDPRTMSGYATASPLARRIADGAAWDLNDEPAALALIDSFENSPHHAFYSAVLLRTLPKADGYYAEPLGLVLYEDLLKRPCSLLACCWENGCDGHQGLLLWTRSIAGEILIEHEDDPWSAFKEYGTKVDAQANADCDLQTRSRTHTFLYEIGQHVKRAIERDSLDALR